MIRIEDEVDDQVDLLNYLLIYHTRTQLYCSIIPTYVI